MNEATLKEIHSELAEKLQNVVGRPLFITVSYKDRDTTRLEHWVCQNNDFGYDDMQLTLSFLQGQVEKDMKPKDNPITLKMHRQLRAKKRQADKRIRSR